MSSGQLKNFASVKPANIEWQNGLPYSLEFDDVYFSIHGAIEESQYVFIEGNQLNEDWNNSSQNNFLLAELGFGSGLNFLVTANEWQAFLRQSNKQKFSKSELKHLHYVAIEKSPFCLVDLIKACKCWPEFAQISEKLIDNYPSQTFARHQITFPEFQLTLTLMFMPVEDALIDLITESKNSENKAKFDHWFLDGFAPDKNSDMWSEANATNIAKLSRTGTRLASYSVAGSVKRALSKVGFEISKCKGFAKKREMLTAVFNDVRSMNVESTFINIKYERPWFNLASDFSKGNENKIAIIGAGIAGCATAYAFAQRGISCDLFDQREGLAQAASGAAAGIFHPQLTLDMNYSSQFSWLSYLRLNRFLSCLNDKEHSGVVLSQGVYRVLENEAKIIGLKQLSHRLSLNKWMKIRQLADKTQVLYFPHSAALNIPTLCQLFISKLNKQESKLRLNTHIKAIEHNDAKYVLSFEQQTKIYDHVIYCAGAKSNLLEQLTIKNTNTTRGQSCFFESEMMADKIKSVLCEKIYLVPGESNRFHLGSTFDDIADSNTDFDTDNSLTMQSQTELLNNLIKLLDRHQYPVLTQKQIHSVPLNGTVGYRLHSSDRMPLVGALFNQQKLQHDFEGLGQRRLKRANLSHYNLPGLWINSAHGSHGLLHSLLSAEHLVSQITNQLSPISCELSNALNPARFLIRRLKQ